MKNFFERTFRFLASLKLAVIVILSLAAMSAIGTFVEAKYDAQYAQKMVYHSPYMYFILALLCINLFNVMIDRLPWKKRHTGFILAHIGIIVLVVGSLVTKLYGIDGSLPIDIGKSNRYVVLPETQFSVYASFGTGDYRLVARSDQDFLLHPPEKFPVNLSVGAENLKVLDYIHYALRSESISPSQDPKAGPAVRLNLQNANVNMTEWLLKEELEAEDVLELGPAKIYLSSQTPEYKGENAVHLIYGSEPEKTLRYYVFTKSRGGLTKKGEVGAGDSIALGWMGLEMRVLSYVPSAEKKVQYRDNKTPNAKTTAAVKFLFRGKEHWLPQNGSLRVFNEDSMYLMNFGNRRLDLGFDIHLKNFTVGRYQGTMRAASYASDVEIPGVLSYHISMNEPLKFNGFTFYQASFQEEEPGKPTTSILSVNKDPGRWIKYLGSFLIVLGTVILFYFKRKSFGSQPKPKEL